MRSSEKILGSQPLGLPSEYRVETSVQRLNNNHIADFYPGSTE